MKASFPQEAEHYSLGASLLCDTVNLPQCLLDHLSHL